MTKNKKNSKKTREALFTQASGAMGVVAAVSAGWPLIDQMNPSKDVEALSKVEIDLTRN